MLDVSVSYNRYKFLGHEFLTWLWYLTDAEGQGEWLRSMDPEAVSLAIGNRIVLENRVGEGVETITIKGDDAGLEEGTLALRKGAFVTEMNLVYRSGDFEWRFSVKGESLDIAGLKVPDTGAVETAEDTDGAILERVFLYEKIVSLIDRLYGTFIRLRLSEKWEKETVPKLRTWIGASERGLSE